MSLDLLITNTFKVRVQHPDYDISQLQTIKVSGVNGSMKVFYLTTHSTHLVTVIWCRESLDLLILPKKIGAYLLTLIFPNSSLLRYVCKCRNGGVGLPTCCGFQWRLAHHLDIRQWVGVRLRHAVVTPNTPTTLLVGGSLSHFLL